MDTMTDQQMMEVAFPDWRNYPPNSMTPLLQDYGKQKVIAFLVLADDAIIQNFANEQPGNNVNVRSSLYKEANRNGVGFDIVLRFEFLFGEEDNPYFESVFYGDDPRTQVEFCKALKEVREFYIFIANNQGKLLKLKHISWSGQDDPLLDEAIGMQH